MLFAGDGGSRSGPRNIPSCSSAMSVLTLRDKEPGFMSGRLTSPDSSRLKATSARQISYAEEERSQIISNTRFFSFSERKKKNSYQLTAFEHFTAQLSHWEVPRQPVNNRFVIKFVFFIRARQKITGQRDYRLLWWSSNKVMPAMVMCQRDSDRAAFGTITLTELTWNDSSWKQRTLYFNRCLY